MDGRAELDDPRIDHNDATIAYMVNAYPKVSHTFIRREILALERLGFTVHRFSLRSDRTTLADPEDLAEHDRTEQLLDAGAMALATDTLQRFRRRPRAAAAALRLSIAIGWRSERGLMRHLVYFVEACRLAKRCDALGVEHVHAHFGTNSAMVAMLCHIAGGPRWSMTVHGPEEFDKPQFIALAEKVRRAAFTVAISSFCRSQIQRWVSYETWSRIQVVRCGVDFTSFEDATNVAEGMQTLVCVGRLSEQKGQLLLIEALAQLAPDYPDLKLVLVGDGEMRTKVEATAAALGVADRLRITGWMDEAGVRRELTAARALVLPSFAEGLPVVIMEAMAAQRPVISTFVAGIPELVVAEETGWLVPAGDMDALAAAMAECLEMLTLDLCHMGEAGAGRVRRLHDINDEAYILADYILKSASKT